MECHHGNVKLVSSAKYIIPLEEDQKQKAFVSGYHLFEFLNDAYKIENVTQFSEMPACI